MSLQKIIDWVDYRLPFKELMNRELRSYPTPKNLNYMWNFGSLAGIALIIMILTGIFLAMNYTPHVDHAFESVEHIMRDVNYGWLIRYIHMNGASFFFIVVYIHIFRGMYYGSYKAPREFLWIIGVVILLLMMATAFLGYVLPWGQMSFWGATVITNLFSAIPFIGNDIVTLLWGGFSVDNPTLNRFFVLHFLLPFVIMAVAGLHVVALHTHGSSNPTGVEKKTKEDSIPFHPFYTIKDIFGLGVFLIIFSAFIFYVPNYLGHPDNYIPANPMVTPSHIVPEWYFLPFYAILRAIPSKLGGVIAMGGAVMILAFLPWLDTSKVKSGRYRPLFKKFFWVFVADAILLGWLGSKPAEEPYILIARLAGTYYFFHFLILMPMLGRIEKPLPIPASIDAAVRAAKKGAKGLLIVLGGSVILMGSAQAHESVQLLQPGWSFDGMFGTFDRASLQRGFQVYKEVCSTCHSMKLVHYRNLADLGFSEAEIKAIAADYKVTDGPNDEGNMFERNAKASDPFHSPFPNEQAARAANNGALPPDLSLITKARHDGPNYVYSVLNGYTEMPAGEKMPEGMNYNAYFAGHHIAMPRPLSDGAVTFADGTTNTTAQMAHDVVTFLTWAAEPKLEKRKALGFATLIFLVIFTVLAYLTKKKIWKKVH